MRIGNNISSSSFRAIKSINYNKTIGNPLTRETGSCFHFKEISEADIDLLRAVKNSDSIKRIAEKNDVDINIESVQDVFSSSASINIKSTEDTESPNVNVKINAKYSSLTPNIEAPKQALVAAINKYGFFVHHDGACYHSHRYNTEQVEKLVEDYNFLKIKERHEEGHSIVDSLLGKES